MSTKDKKGSKIRRYIKAPARALIKARDLYVRSLSNCAGNVSGGVMAYPAQQSAPLPRSFSASSTASGNDDFSELIRANSTTSLAGIKIGSPLNNNGVSVVPRSHTVAIGRIDEDKPVEFGDAVQVNTYVYARRSRSVAVPKRGRMT